jgi:hypothetical protein
MRRCPCGTNLSKANSGFECGPCARLRADARLGDFRAQQALAAREAAIVFAHPERYESTELYLNALTDELDQLCDALRFERPILLREEAAS